MTQTMKARDKWIEHLDEYARQKNQQMKNKAAETRAKYGQ